MFSFLYVGAQSPKRELRSTWLTTVWRLDWPSVTVPVATGSNDAQRQTAINQQKTELIAILDDLKDANMNAAYFQVRSMCDAMYQSSYEPWSAYISSTRGADPGYDPLTFAIEEAHKRGIELHAWLNPYRYSTSSTTHGELPTDYYNTHRDWLLAYDSYLKILNPGLPQVVTQIKSIIGEIVNNYDVDGIVFDDYFYAYGGTSSTLDSTAQRLYKPADKNLGDWRRENVNKMIKAVYDTIQSVKPYVKFGVSPFGTWTTDQTVATKENILLPSGVGTTGNMYAEIYCDPIAWLKEGSVDYISPQLYWTTYSSYPYGILAAWWSDIANRFGKHFYSSHSISALTAASSASSVVATSVKAADISRAQKSYSTLELQAINRKIQTPLQRLFQATNFEPSEVGLQIGYNRSGDINDAPGSVFYATDKLINTSGFIDYLKQNSFTQYSLTPAISWKAAPDQTLVSDLNLQDQLLSWTYAATNVRYAIYAVPNANKDDASLFADSKYLLGVAYSNSFELPVGVSSATHKIAVSIVDRYGNESSVRVLGENETASVATQLIYPQTNSATLLPCVFIWDNVVGADSYVWQLANDAQFTDLVCTRETKEPQFFSGLQTNLKDSTQYYWRVKVRKPNAVAIWSQSQSFSGHKFKIQYPLNGASSVDVTPEFKWDSVSSGATYTIEISTAVNFAESKQVFKQTLQGTELVIPANTLTPSTLYYARVSVDDGVIQATTETSMFTTKDVEIPVPVINSPVAGANVFGTSIEVCWNEQASMGFRVELSKDGTFAGRTTTVKSVDAYTFCTTYTSLTAGTYYIRVKALNTVGTTEASDTVNVNLSDQTGFADILDNSIKCFVRKSGTQSNIVLQSTVSKRVNLRLISITGSEIFQLDTDILEGENVVETQHLNMLPGSVYTVLLTTDEGRKAYMIII